MNTQVMIIIMLRIINSLLINKKSTHVKTEIISVIIVFQTPEALSLRCPSHILCRTSEFVCVSVSQLSPRDTVLLTNVLPGRSPLRVHFERNLANNNHQRVH